MDTGIVIGHGEEDGIVVAVIVIVKVVAVVVAAVVQIKY